MLEGGNSEEDMKEFGEWSNESVEGKNLEMTEKLVSEVTKEYRSKSKWKLEIDTYILMSSCFLFFCPNVAPGRFRISSSLCQIGV